MSPGFFAATIRNTIKNHKTLSHSSVQRSKIPKLSEFIIEYFVKSNSKEVNAKVTTTLCRSILSGASDAPLLQVHHKIDKVFEENREKVGHHKWRQTTLVG